MSKSYSSIQKILIVGPAWVGDMVMAQCLFKLLKQHHSTASIHVLAPTWSLPLLARMPEVDLAIALPIKHGQLHLKERFALGKTLREQCYDQAILLPNSFKSALVPFWAKIPIRTGWCGEMRFGLINDMRFLQKKNYPLMIERFMALGLPPHETLPVERPLPALVVDPKAQSQALAHLGLLHPTKPILALCPGAEFGPAKRWPEKHYAAIANAKKQAGWDIWLFGSPKDQAVAEKIMQLTEQSCVNLVGRTQLAEAIDLLAFANGVVSNDSGLMHIAAALSKPLIAVYGPTSAGFTPPLHQQAKVLSLQLPCQPCFKRHCPLHHQNCMQQLRPNQILDAMQEVSV